MDHSFGVCLAEARPSKIEHVLYSKSDRENCDQVVVCEK